MIEFVVPGQPVPKQRPRRARQGGVFTPAATKQAEQAIGWQLRALRVRPISGDVAITFRFFMADDRWIDVDNLEKLVMDACNLLAYRDDSQVVEKHTYLVRSDPDPRTEVQIREAE